MAGELSIASDQSLGMLLWNTCPAKCAHCGPNSGPKDRTGIPHEKVLELIHEAARIYRPGWCLSLSGGEVFLHYERLLEYTKLANQLGGYTTLITNGFWATSVQSAKEKLLPLKENGLMVLGISADHFHTPYIPIERVKNAIMAARQIDLKTHVRSVASRSGRLSDVVRDLQDAAPWFVNFMEMPLVPEGRGKEIPRTELFLQEALPAGRCPAASMTINAEGKAMVCCNGAGAFPPLQLGDVRNHSLEELEYKFATDPTLAFLNKEGPLATVRFLSKRELWWRRVSMSTSATFASSFSRIRSSRER